MFANYLKRFLISLLALLTVFSVSARGDDSTPPELEKGWNLVASPCDVKLDQLKKKLSTDGFVVYEWNGTDYAAVDNLVRGHGYALNANSVLNTSTVCKQDTATATVKLALRQGWNLIGNPFHKAVTFKDAFGTSISNISVIFEQQGNDFREAAATDNMKVWRGYWVYAKAAMTVELKDGSVVVPPAPEMKTTLVISVSKTQLKVGETATFKATLTTAPVEKCKSTNSSVKCPATTTADVTAKVKWQQTNPDAGAFKENVFTALKTGETAVKATYEDATAGAAAKTIVSEQITLKISAAITKTLVIETDKTQLKVGDAATFKARLTTNTVESCADKNIDKCGASASEDVTAKVKWLLSDGTTGAFKGNVFTASRAGETAVKATYADAMAKATAASANNLVSQPITLKIAGATPPPPPPAKKELVISADKTQLKVGDTATFKAYLKTTATEKCDGANSSGTCAANDPAEDVTAKVKWQLTNPEAGSFKGNVFTAAKDGETTVVAALEIETPSTDPAKPTKETLKSNPVQLRIGTPPPPPPAKKKLSITADKTQLNVGDAATFKATLYTEPEVACLCVDCDCPQPGQPAIAEDVSSKVKWQQTNPDVGVLNGSSFRAAKDGDTTVYATLEIETPSTDPSKPAAEILYSNKVELRVGTPPPPPPAKNTLVISADKTQLKTGETAKFTAYLKTASTTPCDEKKPGSACPAQTFEDVTTKVKWQLSDPGAGAFKENIFTAAGNGETIVTATLEIATPSMGPAKPTADVLKSNEVVLRIDDTPPPPVENKLVISTNKTELLVGEKAIVNAQLIGPDGQPVETFAAIQPEWHLSTPDVGTMGGNVFVAFASGVATVYGSLGAGKIVSNKIEFHVTRPVPKLTSIRIYNYRYSIEPFETASIETTGYYSDGSRKDLAKEVSWTVDPASVGSVDMYGSFHPAGLGAARIQAKLGDITSNYAYISVEKKQLIYLAIYPKPEFIWLALSGNFDGDYDGTYYIYKGKTGTFKAEANYSNGRFTSIENNLLEWEVKDPAILSSAGNGTFTALKEGITAARAYREGVYSGWVWVQVVTPETKKFLMLNYSHHSVVLPVGGGSYFTALYSERVSETVGDAPKTTSRYGNREFKTTVVNDKATWLSGDTAVFKADSRKVTGMAPGRAPVWAEYDGLVSQKVDIEVWKSSEITPCDASKPNTDTWGDGMGKAVLETSCATYSKGEKVPIQFSAGIDQYSGRHVLDVCLDLYIYDTNQKLVRTIRDYGCSPEKLFKTLPGYRPVYDQKVDWDQRDNAGNAVPAGDYLAVARFYLLYCPVLKVKFTIQ